MRYADIPKEQLKKMMEEIIQELNENDVLNIPSDRRGAHWLNTKWWRSRRKLGKRYGRIRRELEKR